MDLINNSINNNNEKKDLLYVAGRLFSESDQRQRTFEKNELERLCGDEIEVFSPLHDNPSNDKSTLPTAEDIFINDTKQIVDSKYILAELDGEDAGVMAELGIVWGINFMKDMIMNEIYNSRDEIEALDRVEWFLNSIPNKEIIAHLTDIRVETTGEYDEKYVPFGYNQYVIAMVESIGTIHNSTNKAIEDLKNTIEN